MSDIVDFNILNFYRFARCNTDLNLMIAELYRANLSKIDVIGDFFKKHFDTAALYTPETYPYLLVGSEEFKSRKGMSKLGLQFKKYRHLDNYPVKGVKSIAVMPKGRSEPGALKKIREFRKHMDEALRSRLREEVKKRLSYYIPAFKEAVVEAKLVKPSILLLDAGMVIALPNCAELTGKEPFVIELITLEEVLEDIEAQQFLRAQGKEGVDEVFFLSEWAFMTIGQIVRVDNMENV